MPPLQQLLSNSLRIEKISFLVRAAAAAFLFLSGFGTFVA
jgi:hypothetical protein